MGWLYRTPTIGIKCIFPHLNVHSLHPNVLADWCKCEAEGEKEGAS